MRRRVSIKVRLTLAFGAVMTLVFTATGLFVYSRMRADLTTTVDTGLRTRAADIVALFQQRAGGGVIDPGHSQLTERGENLAQILSADGSVLDATPRYRAKPLIGADELRRAVRQTILVEHGRPPSLDSPVRLIATPVRAGRATKVVVVGALLDDRNEALHRLVVLLFICGPIALALAVAAGYGVAKAALRPVEAMRHEASKLSATDAGGRLPVPPAHDEIARLGASLNEMLTRLEAAFERERSFVSDASHELRSPLSILRTELELALHEGRSKEELRDAVRSAAEETDRLTRLAEDLLVLARSDRGKLPLRAENVAVARLLETVRMRFAERAAAAGRTITIAVTPSAGGGDLTVHADPQRIEQALTNLIDNALRYASSDILIRVAEAEAAVEVHVCDSGAGFSDEFLPRAFERFTRADHARSRGGTGLGLAIVAAIAQAHGGTAHARNRIEGGSDVWLRLPTGEAAPATPPAHLTAGSHPGLTEQR
jgi:two-component system OmpR family sensor kinase